MKIYPQNYKIQQQNNEMKFDKVLFRSPQKQEKRISILKGRTQLKDETTKQQKGLSTTIRHSVTFKDPLKEPNQQNQVKQFVEKSYKDNRNSDQKGLEMIESTTAQKSYNKWKFLKDVNNINHLYNQILIMVTSNTNNFNQKTNSKQPIQMSKTIEGLVHQNIELKQQIDQKHKVHCDLHELAEYLHCTFEQLTKEKILQNFLTNYCKKQWMALQQICKDIPQKPKYKAKGLTQGQIRDKQKKCQALTKKIEKEKNVVKKLQKEEKQLLKELYQSQKQINKNDRLSSALKLKINQLEIDKNYQQGRIRTKTIFNKIEDKQNIYPSNQLRHLKVKNKELLKSKSSLAKLIKK